MELPPSYKGKFKITPKVKYEFQALGIELEPFYGKKVWALFYRSNLTEEKIRKAHDIALKRGIIKYPYLIGILNKI